MSFTRSGVSVRSGSTEVGLSLLAVGYGSTLASLARVAPSAHANRVLYQHPDLDEWYANGPLGIEQGFTVAHAPARSAVGPLTITLALFGNVLAKPAEHGRGLTLTHAGHPVLRYAALQTSDSRGRVLRSWLALERGRIVLRVDTAGARYPLRIDPLIQQGEKLNGTGHAGETLFDHIGEGAFGYSVALSADGNTALIGGPGDNGGAANNGGVGAVWVFTRSGSTWTQQGEKLTGGGENGEGEFGSSVALWRSPPTAIRR